MPLITDTGVPLDLNKSLKHRATKGLVLINENKCTRGTEEAVERILKRKRRQEVPAIVKVSSEEAPSAETLTSPLTKVRAKEGYGEASSPFMNKIIDLAWINLEGEPRMECLRVLTILFMALATDIEGL